MPRRKKVILVAPAFEVEIDTTQLLDRFSKNRWRTQVRKALKEVGIDYAERVHKGFIAQGVDPRTGRKQFWPKLKIPAGITRKGGRTKKGKILKKSGKYLKAVAPKNARIIIRGNDNDVLMQVAYPRLPDYAQHHEQQGNAQGFTTQIATKKQAAFLRGLGYLGAQEGSIITLPARRVFVYPPTWKGVSARLFKRVLAKLWST